MLLLFAIGYLNALVFLSDILTKYAIMGFILLFLYRLHPKFIILITVLLLLHIPEWIQPFHSIRDVNFQLVSHRNSELWERITVISATGSFADVIKMNMWQGFIELWKLNITSGRLANIMGYFLLGFLIGKSRLLEDINQNRKTYFFILFLSVNLYIILRYTREVVSLRSDYQPESIMILQSIITEYMNFLMVSILISLFILLYQVTIFQAALNILRTYGRMSLSSYVFQSFLGVLLFYGFGFGLYDYLGPFLSLCAGGCIFLFLLISSKIWFRYFQFGPLEWAWRNLTYKIHKAKV